MDRLSFGVCLRLSRWLRFYSNLGQTNDLKVGIYSFPILDVQQIQKMLKTQSGEENDNFSCCAVGKALNGITQSLVIANKRPLLKTNSLYRFHHLLMIDG